jgi:hypothetical protein
MKARTHNSTYQQLAVQWLNEALWWQIVLRFEIANFLQLEKVRGKIMTIINNNKKLFLSFGLLTLYMTCFAQQKDDFHIGYNYFKDPISHGRLDFILGYQRLNNNTYEFGLASGHRGYEGSAHIYANYHLTTEHNFNDRYTLGTKIGYKLSILFFDLTGQAIYYTDFKESNFAFRPELGLTFFGLFDINYGYNFMPLKDNLKQFKGHIIAIRWTFGKGSSGVF